MYVRMYAYKVHAARHENSIFIFLKDQITSNESTDGLAILIYFIPIHTFSIRSSEDMILFLLHNFYRRSHDVFTNQTYNHVFKANVKDKLLSSFHLSCNNTHSSNIYYLSSLRQQSLSF
jgi:hypothetical protein